MFYGVEQLVDLLICLDLGCKVVRDELIASEGLHLCVLRSVPRAGFDLLKLANSFLLFVLQYFKNERGNN